MIDDLRFLRLSAIPPWETFTLSIVRLLNPFRPMGPSCVIAFKDVFSFHQSLVITCHFGSTWKLCTTAPFSPTNDPHNWIIIGLHWSHNEPYCGMEMIPASLHCRRVTALRKFTRWQQLKEPATISWRILVKTVVIAGLLSVFIDQCERETILNCKGSGAHGRSIWRVEFGHNGDRFLRPSLVVFEDDTDMSFDLDVEYLTPHGSTAPWNPLLVSHRCFLEALFHSSGTQSEVQNRFISEYAEGLKSWAVISVGIVSTVLLNLIMVKQNKKSEARLLDEQTNYEGEFPFPVPDSVFADVERRTSTKRATKNSSGDIINIEPPVKTDRRMSGDHAFTTDPLEEQARSSPRVVAWGPIDRKTPSQMSNINKDPTIQQNLEGITEMKGSPEIYPSKEFSRRISQEGPSGAQRPSNAMSPMVAANPKGVHTFTDSSKSSLGSQVTSDMSMSMTSLSWVDATVEREPFEYKDEQLPRERGNPTNRSV
ncbi:unnamed protein product [Nesidiocoris tenuis]|uniref:Uncharacterized protein n=1 Tax=Nesidiocoris tenuis TaxID=355587 RepID=A0A6H5HNS4_9HEMI|nr:unnamed protein product [Nesidiocoris tenuis]